MIAVALGLACLWLGSASAEEGNRKQTWSYAYLQYGFTDTGDPSVIWCSPSQQLRARTLDDMAAKLGGTRRPAEIPPEIWLLNLIGAEGWEAVSISRDRAPFVPTNALDGTSQNGAVIFFFKKAGN
jgi:hypothetical protein